MQFAQLLAHYVDLFGLIWIHLNMLVEKVGRSLSEQTGSLLCGLEDGIQVRDPVWRSDRGTLELLELAT